ncbi:MAG TPA: ABC transporter permease [Solirubrobacteraceae bacterium]|nr:ABC transporter permease [Solirubrobacteraceae bacterium]
MRWLLHKDFLILRRSRVLVAVLVVYPVAIALLIGLALSRSPGKPKVAIVNLAPPGATVELGGSKVEVGRYYSQLFSEVQPLKVKTRAEAIEKVRSGEALAAVVIPANIAAKLSSVLSQGQLEVIYNGDALQQSLAQSKIQAAVAQANLEISLQIRKLASRGISLLLQGGDLSQLGINQKRLLGLEQLPKVLSRVIARVPTARDKQELQRIKELADFAASNLNLSRNVLATIGQPVQVRSVLVHGRRTPLDTFAVVVAVSISLMFVCVLLAAGGIALEREDNTLPRLLRGPPGSGGSGGAGGSLISREGLVAEKLLLAGACSLVLAFAMLAGIGAFVTLDWSRIGLWLLALVAGALAFGALGVAIGALAREVRAASLLAFLLSLPLAFLALVPAGAVAPGVYDVIRAVSVVFPFKAALQALDAAVNGAEPAIAGSLAHLLALTLLFGILARIGLRRT